VTVGGERFTLPGSTVTLPGETVTLPEGNGDASKGDVTIPGAEVTTTVFVTLGPGSAARPRD